jgi:hypothetical protein
MVGLFKEITLPVKDELKLRDKETDEEDRPLTVLMGYREDVKVNRESKLKNILYRKGRSFLNSSIAFQDI